MGAAAAAAALIFRRQSNFAHLADEPLRELQALFADKLGIDSFRMIERMPSRSRAGWQTGASITYVLNVSFGLTAHRAWAREW